MTSDAGNLFDLDQLVPPEVRFKFRNGEVGIVPAFSVADEARYQRLEQRLSYEQRIAFENQQHMNAYILARIAAEKEGTDLPVQPEPVMRDAAMPLYSNADLERDVFDLLGRLWQASEASKPEAERGSAFTPRDLTIRQALEVVRHLWPRRYGQRTAAPAAAPSAEPEPAAEPQPARKRGRSRAA